MPVKSRIGPTIMLFNSEILFELKAISTMHRCCWRSCRQFAEVVENVFSFVYNKHDHHHHHHHRQQQRLRRRPVNVHMRIIDDGECDQSDSAMWRRGGAARKARRPGVDWTTMTAVIADGRVSAGCQGYSSMGRVDGRRRTQCRSSSSDKHPEVAHRLTCMCGSHIADSTFRNRPASTLTSTGRR